MCSHQHCKGKEQGAHQVPGAVLGLQLQIKYLHRQLVQVSRLQHKGVKHRVPGGLEGVGCQMSGASGPQQQALAFIIALLSSHD